MKKKDRLINVIDRRCMLRLAPVALVGAWNVTGRGFAAKPSELDSRIEQFFAQNLVIDGVMQPRPKAGEWLKQKGQLKQLTGVNACCMTMPPGKLDSIVQWLEKNDETYIVVRTAADLSLAQSSRRFGVLPYIQSGFSGDEVLVNLSVWHAAGLRVFQPTYSKENKLGGGSTDDESPLSKLGHQALEMCEHLGIVFDLSHCGKKTTLDAAKAAKHPLTANHCNPEELCKTRRNKSIAELRMIARTGGVVGVMAITGNLKRKGKASAEDFAQHVEYLVQKIGIDHVGVATDGYSDGRNKSADYEGDYTLRTFNRWKNVARHLATKGYKDEQLAKVFGLNFKRVYDEILD